MQMRSEMARSQTLGKRHADESNLNDSERFIAKRLHLLKIGKSRPTVKCETNG